MFNHHFEGIFSSGAIKKVTTAIQKTGDHIVYLAQDLPNNQCRLRQWPACSCESCLLAHARAHRQTKYAITHSLVRVPCPLGCLFASSQVHACLLARVQVHVH